eukprot:TRINITY_DN7342_c0_g1_i1.p1 TRINITY_DN7342_c0_g1~~TRINITY_DN7342_c0_g1_i1.p1  ORF type:complete len:224 (+),score=27.49 TRINITY_DN7342_c0_g1_i1:86-757(+)
MLSVTVLLTYFFFFNDPATTEIYTLHIVGSVRCVQETGYQRRVHGQMRESPICAVQKRRPRRTTADSVVAMPASSALRLPSAMTQRLSAVKAEENQDRLNEKEVKKITFPLDLLFLVIFFTSFSFNLSWFSSTLGDDPAIERRKSRREPRQIKRKRSKENHQEQKIEWECDFLYFFFVQSILVLFCFYGAQSLGHRRGQKRTKIDQTKKKQRKSLRIKDRVGM